MVLVFGEQLLAGAGGGSGRKFNVTLCSLSRYTIKRTPQSSYGYDRSTVHSRRNLQRGKTTPRPIGSTRVTQHKYSRTRSGQLPQTTMKSWARVFKKKEVFTTPVPSNLQSPEALRWQTAASIRHQPIEPLLNYVTHFPLPAYLLSPNDEEKKYPPTSSRHSSWSYLQYWWMWVRQPWHTELTSHLQLLPIIAVVVIQ